MGFFKKLLKKIATPALSIGGGIVAGPAGAAAGAAVGSAVSAEKPKAAPRQKAAIPMQPMEPIKVAEATSTTQGESVTDIDELFMKRRRY